MTQMGELIDRSYTFIINEKLETLITARLPTGNTQCSRLGGIKYNAILSSIFLTNLQLGLHRTGGGAKSVMSSA